MNETVKCSQCQERTARHRFSEEKNLCCECYVKAGNPPSDWHPDCMRTFGEIKSGNGDG